MENLKSAIISNLDILLFLILIPIKLILFTKQLDPNYYYYHSIYYSIFASTFILASISYLFSSKKRSKILVIINIITSMLIIIDLNYFRYFKDILSILVVRNIFQLGAVKSSVGSIFKAQDLLYLSDILIIFLINSILKRRSALASKNPLRMVLKRRVVVVLAILIVTLSAENYAFRSLSKEQPGI